MKKISSAVLGLALAISVHASAAAQVFTPTFQAPTISNDVGVYVSDASGLAVEGILRRGQLGLRLGLTDDVTHLLVGADYRAPLSVNAAPLALALTLGGQGVLGDANAFGAQVGVSIGGTIRSPGLNVTPYIHPRAAVIFGGDEEELELLADVGVDLAFNRNLALRFGLNLGDVDTFGIGLAVRR